MEEKTYTDQELNVAIANFNAIARGARLGGLEDFSLSIENRAIKMNPDGTPVLCDQVAISYKCPE